MGANPVVSHGSILTAPRIRDRLHDVVERGGRVVVVDPRRTETAAQFEWLGIVPDTDALFLLSLLAVLFAEGLVDRRRVSAQAEGWIGWPPSARRSPRTHRTRHRHSRRDRAWPGPRPGWHTRRGLRAVGHLRGTVRHPGVLSHRRGQPVCRQSRRPRWIGVRLLRSARRARGVRRPRERSCAATTAETVRASADLATSCTPNRPP